MDSMVNSDDLIVRLSSSNFITWNLRIFVRCLKAGWVVMSSLVPRPHPLTRRNGLVNQVEFLGLMGALATV